MGLPLFRSSVPMLVGVGALLSLPAAADPLLDAFRAPPRAAGPMLRWWWPGGDVEKATIEAELAAFDRAGIGGVEIQPFTSGLAGASPDEVERVNDYATPRFFAHVAEAIAAAKALGMAVDYTFGSAWPSGGGEAITPELAQLDLVVADQGVEGPARFHGPIPRPDGPRKSALSAMLPRFPGQAMPADWMARLDALRRVVAVIAVKGTAPVFHDRARPQALPFMPAALPPEVQRPGALETGTAVVLTGKVGADGVLDWQVPAGHWRLMVFEQVWSGLDIIPAAGAGPQLVLDHFSSTAFDAHAARVGDAGLPALAGARSIFVDSFELPVTTYWSRDLLDAFRRRRGYDLTGYLPLILQPDWMNPFEPASALPEYEMGSAGDRVRADYRRTVSDLMLDRYMRPLADWAHGHGMSVRLQAHGAPVDLVQAYGLVDIPETEDLFAGPDPDFLTIARSAADIYGRPIVGAESFIILGHALDVTPAMLKARADTLLAAGVNRIVMHGAAYAHRLDGGLGWYPWGALFGSDLNPRNPIFAYLRPLSDYIARLQAVLQATGNVVPVAIYQDALTVQSSTIGAPKPPAATAAALRQAGYDSDRLTADGLLGSRVEGGQLVTPGGMRYGVIVLDGQVAFRPETARQLAALSRAGLAVVAVGGLPGRAEGLDPAGTSDRKVRRAMAALRAGRFAVATPDRAPEALRRFGIEPDLVVRAGTRPDVLEKTDGARRLFFLANPGGEADALTLELAGGGRVERWDPWTGTVDRPQQRAVPGATRVELALPAQGSVLLVQDPLVATVTVVPSAEAAAPVATPIGAEGWSFTADGFGAGNRRIALEMRLATLADWTRLEPVRDLAGTGTYRTDFTIPATGGSLTIDLGEVHDVASVTINGCSAVLAVPPFRLEVTEALRPGVNRLEVAVADTPFNAFAGRTLQGMPVAGPARPAGLLGPVTIASGARGRHLSCRAAG